MSDEMDFDLALILFVFWGMTIAGFVGVLIGYFEETSMTIFTLVLFVILNYITTKYLRTHVKAWKAGRPVKYVLPPEPTPEETDSIKVFVDPVLNSDPVKAEVPPSNFLDKLSEEIAELDSQSSNENTEGDLEA